MLVTACFCAPTILSQANHLKHIEQMEAVRAAKARENAEAAKKHAERKAGKQADTGLTKQSAANGAAQDQQGDEGSGAGGIFSALAHALALPCGGGQCQRFATHGAIAP